MPDHDWPIFIPGINTGYAPWLHDHGSLTRHIQQCCKQFSVQLQHNGLAHIAHDESTLLGIAPKQLAWTREVFLYADGRPVVFAHSTCAAHHLRGAWQALNTLNNKPLGAMLFTHPLVKRGALHYKLLRPSHLLHRNAATSTMQTLWARRSLFYLNNAPLLVTEVFLPGILELKI